MSLATAGSAGTGTYQAGLPFLRGALPVVAPWMEAAAEQVRQRVTGDPGAVALALPHLEESLLELLGRPVVLELQAARLLGRLPGGTPRGRFDAFVADLPAAGLLDRYPVLAQQVEECADRWAAAVGELLERLHADRELLRSRLCGGADPGPVVGLRLGAGDRHRGGRSVAIVTFASGAEVVYKPRSLAVDAHFQEFLGWLGARPAQRPMTVLDRGAYGWCERVRPEPCTTAAQVTRFYERLGGLLAVLHVLRGVDVHHENLVAAGEHPVIVDGEALFHPQLCDFGNAAKQAIEESVQRVALLPWRAVRDATGEGADTTGIGAVEGTPWPWHEPYWIHPGTDRMSLARGRAPAVRTSDHRPVLDGAPVDPEPHVEDVVAGFRAAYDLLRARSAELLAAGGPLARFAADEVRVLARPTHVYELVRRTTLHPDALRDTAARRRALDALWGRVAVEPVLARLVAAEQADLCHGDIPLFTARPDATDLWTSGGERLPGVTGQSGMDSARAVVRGLGPVDRDRQEWMIRASFAGLSRSGLRARSRPGTRTAPAGGAPVPPERLVAAARAIGDQLVSSACRRGAEADWVGLAPGADGRWAIGPLGRGVEHGLPGVALFLARLAAATGDPRYAETAGAAWVPVWNGLREGGLARLGGRPNAASVVRVAALAVGLPGGPARPEVEELIARLEPAVTGATPDPIDLVALGEPVAERAWGADHSLAGGDLGHLELLLTASRAPGGGRWAGPLADGVGAVLNGAGRTGWRCPNPAGIATPGLAQGLAGIGYQLLRLADADRVPSVLVLVAGSGGAVR